NGERPRLVRRGVRETLASESPPLAVVHVVSGRGVDRAGGVLLWFFLRGDEERVRRVLERHAVFLAEPSGVGVVGVDRPDLVRYAEAVEDLDHAPLHVVRGRVGHRVSSRREGITTGTSLTRPRVSANFRSV